MVYKYYAIKCPDQDYFQSTDCKCHILILIETAFLLSNKYFFFSTVDLHFVYLIRILPPPGDREHIRGPAHSPPSEHCDGSTPLSLVAMETRRWQHPAVCSASILIPLRGAAECVRSRHRYVTHCKMANARRMVCFVLYISLGKLFSPLLCDISSASHWTLRGASLRYVTQRPMLMW